MDTFPVSLYCKPDAGRIYIVRDRYGRTVALFQAEVWSYAPDALRDAGQYTDGEYTVAGEGRATVGLRVAPDGRFRFFALPDPPRPCVAWGPSETE